MPRILGPAEVAEILIISRDTAEDLIRKMPHFAANPGSQRPMWRVTEPDLMDYIRTAMVYPAETKKPKPMRLDPNLFEPDGRVKRRK